MSSWIGGRHHKSPGRRASPPRRPRRWSDRVLTFRWPLAGRSRGKDDVMSSSWGVAATSLDAATPIPLSGHCDGAAPHVALRTRWDLAAEATGAARRASSARRSRTPSIGRCHGRPTPGATVELHTSFGRTSAAPALTALSHTSTRVEIQHPPDAHHSVTAATNLVRGRSDQIRGKEQ
jgi:hypothetical protein